MTGAGKRFSLFLLVLMIACGGATPATPSSRPAVTSVAETSAPPTVGAGEEWIVFQGVALGFTLIRPDGTGKHVILDELPGDQLHPDWSPDGSQLAFVQATDDSTWDIWISDPNGTNAAPLLEEYPPELADLIWDNPAWSRDGSQIAMIGYEGNPNLELPRRAVLTLVDVATDAISVAGDYSFEGPVPGLSFPRWSPDGQAMVVTVGQFEEDFEFTGEAVAVITFDGDTWSTPAVITPFDDFATRPDWHPTDNLIVFATHDVGYLPSTDLPSNLFTVRPDGSELTQVTDFGPGEERASQPSWTADGRIIFTHSSGSNDEHGNLAFVNADGSSLELISTPEVVGKGNRPHPRLRPVA